MAAKATSEIFKTANAISEVQDRVTYLRENATIAVKEMININFNPDIKFLLPEGSPDLETDEDGMKPGGLFPNLGRTDDGANLNYEIRKMYLFVEGMSPQNLTQIKRETLWIQLINSLGRDEAEDLSLVKDKKLEEKYPNITHEVAHLAFSEFVRQPQKDLKRDNKGRFSKKKKEEKE